MFSVNVAVKAWAENLNGIGRFTRSELDELEDHLFQLVVVETEKGFSDEQAFEIAAGKMGDSVLLADEYARNSSLQQMLMFFTANIAVTRSLGALVLFGGLFHLFYFLRYFLRMESGLTVMTSILFLIVVWSVYRGIRMLAGSSAGSAGLCLFFLAQVPVLYFPEFRYDFFSGFAATLNFGNAPWLFGFGAGAELHIDTSFTSEYAFVGINFYALAMVVIMGLRMFRSEKVVRESAA